MTRQAFFMAAILPIFLIDYIGNFARNLGLVGPLRYLAIIFVCGTLMAFAVYLDQWRGERKARKRLVRELRRGNNGDVA